MKKVYIALVLILIALGMSLIYQNNTDTRDKQVIKIGYILPLSGNVGFLGEGVKNAVMLAVEDFNAKNTKYEYQVLFEDDAFTPAKTISAAQKLIEIDHVDALATFASAAGSAVNPIAEKAGVVHFSIASDPHIAEGAYNFLNWTPPQEEVKVFVGELKKRNIKKIAVFGQKISGITAVIDELKKQIEGTDIEIVSENISNFGDKDFRTAIKKAEAAHPDYHLLVMFSPELEIVARQMKELGVTTPLTAIESFEMSDDPKLFEGMWYVNAANPTDTFATDYMNTYGKQASIATPNGYDIYGLIVTAVETFNAKTKPTATAIAQKLHEIKGYDGALGDDLMINSDGLVISQATLRIIKDGKPTDLK